MATIEDVRSALQAEEPDYAALAHELGPEALPHLQALLANAEPLMASKATYLAAVIGREDAMPLVRQAARSAYASVRVAAAAAAALLPDEPASNVLLPLVDDVDLGVQKVALRSVPAHPSAGLYARVQALNARDVRETIRKASEDALERAAKGKQ